MSSLEAVIEAADARIQSKKATAKIKFRELVIALVDGQADGTASVSATEIANTLEKIDRSTADLTEAVATYTERKRLVQVVTAAEGMTEKRAQQAIEYGEARKRFEQIEKDNEAELTRLQGEVNQTSQTIRDADNARRQLLATCSRETNEKYRSLTTQIDRLSHELSGMLHTVEETRLHFNAIRDEVEKAGPDHVTPDQQKSYDFYCHRAQSALDARTAKEAERDAVIAERQELLSTEVVKPTDF